MRIVIVDDSDEGRNLTEALLLDAGYEDIVTADSAAAVFALLAIEGSKTSPPYAVDLVLLDILMPDIDGIETCARIRNDPRYSDVPIIMVTRLADLDSLANAFVAGATDYINKPVNRVELVARVRSALRLKAELDRRLARERELLQFMSNGDDGLASRWIDEASGLFVGDLAVAYLLHAAKFHPAEDSSVIAIAIDRLDAYHMKEGESSSTGVVAQVVRTIRATSATVGTVAASYRGGIIILVAPDVSPKAALALGKALHASIGALAIANSVSAAVDHITASVAVVTESAGHLVDPSHLLTRAILAAQQMSAAGGNRVELESA